jgi:pyridoxamine 5'-phosphate oxidase
LSSRLARVPELRRSDLAADPLEQFRGWFEEARGVVRAPEAMAVATATPDGQPSARMLLLKGADEDGFAFYTGYESRKGAELETNPRAALLFYWDGRQVRVEGTVERLPAAESDAYFATRPRGAQLGAVVSRQSGVLGSRTDLEQAVEELAAAAGEVARPESWGGFRLVPDRYEFWQHRDDRLHDRFRYSRDGDGWRIERLYP